jgi:ABC-2 type transport system ATP-binding protein
VEYLELIGGLRHIEPATLKTRIDRYLDLFGLASDIYTPLQSFSKGMRQKVLIAAALIHDPDIIVLDEPNSGLDVASTLILRSLVRTLAARGKIIIYSSHVLDIFDKICPRVLLPHQSRVVAHYSVSRLRELAQAASLEEVFASLAVDQNVEQIGRDLAEVSLS